MKSLMQYQYAQSVDHELSQLTDQQCDPVFPQTWLLHTK